MTGVTVCCLVRRTRSKPQKFPFRPDVDRLLQVTSVSGREDEEAFGEDEYQAGTIEPLRSSVRPHPAQLAVDL